MPKLIMRAAGLNSSDRVRVLVKSLTRAFALVAWVFISPASASEGSVYGGPLGGTDIGNALLPSKAGLYFGIVDVVGPSNKLYNGNGDVNTSAHANVFVDAVGLGLLYVYPFKLLGGNLGTSVQESYQIGHVNLNGQKDKFSGVADIYSDLAEWSKYLGPMFGEGNSIPAGSRLPYGLTVKLAYSMIFPVGRYAADQLYTPGHNDYFFIPNAAFTYLTPPNRFGSGFEVDGHFFQNFASENGATNYYSGTVSDFDFALTERTNRWQYGIQGYYAVQIQNDTRNGIVVSPGGKRLQLLDIGPLLSYSFPKIGSNIKAKVEFPVYVQNAFNTTRFVVSYSMPF